MLYMIRGASCVGKTTFIRHMLSDKLCISSTYIRSHLKSTGQNPNNQNQKVFQNMWEQFYDIIVDNPETDVVLDSSFLRYTDCRRYVDYCKLRGIPVKIISLGAPNVEVLFERNNKRYAETGFLVPESALAAHYKICNMENVNFRSAAELSGGMITFMRLTVFELIEPD